MADEFHDFFEFCATGESGGNGGDAHGVRRDPSFVEPLNFQACCFRVLGDDITDGTLGHSLILDSIAPAAERTKEI